MSKDTQKILNLDFTVNYQGCTIQKAQGTKQIDVLKNGSLRHTLTCGVTWDCVGHYKHFLEAVKLADALKWDVLKFCKGYDMSQSDVFGTYNKDSYRWGKDSLYNIIEKSLCCNGITEQILKTYSSLDFSETSAVLYNNTYVTPCMLDVILYDLFKRLDDNDLKKLNSDFKTIALKTIAEKSKNEGYKRLYKQRIKDYKHDVLIYITDSIIDDIRKNNKIIDTINMIDNLNSMVINKV